MTEEKSEPIRKLSQHLAATRERPVEREASRWLGEADAIADDLVSGDVTNLEPAVVEKRVEHIAELLSNIEGTGDSTADEHVEAARDLAEIVLEPDRE